MIPDVASVRKRPAMFVGDCDSTGPFTLLLEVVGNAFDQHLAGRCSHIDVRVDADGTVTVVDDGPGMHAHGGDGLPPLEQMLTTWSHSPTVDGHRPHVHLTPGGGCGLFVVNALSERLELVTVRDEIETTIGCSRGEVVTPMATTEVRRPPGTRVRYRPDREIFRFGRISRSRLATHFEDLSFLAPRLALSWTIAGDAMAGGGIAARVAIAAACAIEDVAHHAGTYETESGPIDVEVALRWDTGGGIESFVNLGRTRGDGTHVDGLFDGVRAFVGGGPRKALAEGLHAVVAVVLADVKYGSPTKDQLLSPQVRPAVADATREALARWERAHPDEAAALRARRR